MQTQAKDNWKLFKPSACNLKLKGSTQEEVFEEIVSQLIKAKALSDSLRDSAVQALNEREALASTGVGHNVAIPHVKLGGIDEPVFSISLLPDGIEWNAVDGEPVKIFFVVLRPERAAEKFDPERHLEMMRWISQLARVSDFRNFALAAATKKELVELLREMPGLQEPDRFTQLANAMELRRTVLVTNDQGLHARPCHSIVTAAMPFQSELVIRAGGREVNGKSILDLMTLGASQGSELELCARGRDAEGLLAAIASLFADGFGETKPADG